MPINPNTLSPSRLTTVPGMNPTTPTAVVPRPAPVLPAVSPARPLPGREDAIQAMNAIQPFMGGQTPQGFSTSQSALQSLIGGTQPIREALNMLQGFESTGGAEGIGILQGLAEEGTPEALQTAIQALTGMLNAGPSQAVLDAQDVFRAISSGNFTQSDAFNQSVIQPVLTALGNAGMNRAGTVGTDVARAVVPFVMQAAQGLAETGLAQDQLLSSIAQGIGGLDINRLGQMINLGSQLGQLGLEGDQLGLNAMQTFANTALGQGQVGLGAASALGSQGLQQQGQQINAILGALQSAMQGTQIEESTANALMEALGEAATLEAILANL